MSGMVWKAVGVAEVTDGFDGEGTKSVILDDRSTVDSRTPRSFAEL